MSGTAHRTNVKTSQWEVSILHLFMLSLGCAIHTHWARCWEGRHRGATGRLPRRGHSYGISKNGQELTNPRSDEATFQVHRLGLIFFTLLDFFKSCLNHLGKLTVASQRVEKGASSWGLYIFSGWELFTQLSPRQHFQSALLFDKKRGRWAPFNSPAVRKVTSPSSSTLVLKLRNPEVTTALGHWVQKWEMPLTRSSVEFNQNLLPIDLGTQWFDHLARKPYALVLRSPVSNNSIQSSLNLLVLEGNYW